jgi:hypothetical protein
MRHSLWLKSYEKLECFAISFRFLLIVLWGHLPYYFLSLPPPTSVSFSVKCTAFNFIVWMSWGEIKKMGPDSLCGFARIKDLKMVAGDSHERTSHEADTGPQSQAWLGKSPRPWSRGNVSTSDLPGRPVEISLARLPFQSLAPPVWDGAWKLAF